MCIESPIRQQKLGETVLIYSYFAWDWRSGIVEIGLWGHAGTHAFNRRGVKVSRSWLCIRPWQPSPIGLRIEPVATGSAQLIDSRDLVYNGRQEAGRIVASVLGQHPPRKAKCLDTCYLPYDGHKCDRSTVASHRVT